MNLLLIVNLMFRLRNNVCALLAMRGVSLTSRFYNNPSTKITNSTRL
jgi:hypothetical protein